MTETNRRMALTVYNSLFNALTGAGDITDQAPPAPQIYLSLQPSGRFIDPQDYANPWAPGNIKGSRPAAVALARLADECHVTSPSTQLQTNLLHQVYGQVLQANVDGQSENPDEKKAREAADKLLYRDVNEVDPETGKKTPKHVESVGFREYQNLRQKYLTARSAYTFSYIKAQETEQGRDTWPELGPTLRAPVDAAWEDWRGADADEIESALAVLETTGHKQVASAFADANKLYQAYGVDLTGDGTTTYRSAVYPTNWTDADAAQDWPLLTIEQGTQETNSSQESTSYSGDAGVGNGLWGWGGGVDGSHTENHDHLSDETSSLKVSFRYCLCTLSRPWLDTTLLGMPSWSTDAYKEGRISDGGRRQQDTALPMISTSFLCVRDLSITAKWAKSDTSHASSSTRGGAEYGWGPFRLGGASYGHDSKSSHHRADFDGSTLSQKGLQIIGWTHQIVPFCPPKRT
ncbi:hypothetical protein [Embleya sp. NPDC020886]|uniref:hypothetical protein n=1 Tax=Embleya sp. NPDC020886 TaxID=3363980 RepID=UPI00378EB973